MASSRARASPSKNPVTGAEHRARIDLPHGFEYEIAEVGSGTTKTQGNVVLDLKVELCAVRAFAPEQPRGDQASVGLRCRSKNVVHGEACPSRPLVAVGGLALIAALAWLYILAGAGTGMRAWHMISPSLFPIASAKWRWAAW